MVAEFESFYSLLSERQQRKLKIRKSTLQIVLHKLDLLLFLTLEYYLKRMLIDFVEVIFVSGILLFGHLYFKEKIDIFRCTYSVFCPLSNQ